MGLVPAQKLGFLDGLRRRVLFWRTERDVRDHDGRSDSATRADALPDDLDVMITHDDYGFFAQGIQLNYVAQGETLEQVIQVFEYGLTRTIDQQVAQVGHVVLRPASTRVLSEWESFRKTAKVAKASMLRAISVTFRSAA